MIPKGLPKIIKNKLQLMTGYHQSTKGDRPVFGTTSL